MNSEEKLDLLARYTSGSATPEERTQVESWFEQLQLPVQDWPQLSPEAQQLWLDGLYQDIRQANRAGETPVVPLPARSRWWRPFAAAAAVLALITAAWLFWPVKPAQHQLAVLQAPAAHLRFLRLPDSSSVWVNAGSRVSYPARFSGKTREVYLSGEAYFDIRHEAAHPFIIHTGPVVTTVLGTAFDIREDPATHQVTVTVKRGKVSVANGDRQVAMLLPDQQVKVDPRGESAVTHAVNTDQVIAWHGGDMRFDNSTFGDAARKLEQHFGITIKFANDKLKNCRFTGAASADESPEQVLKVICAFNNAGFSEQADGSIVISGAGCNP